eukprot:SAG31_NODE_4823_length_2927_cov_3403.860679_3_plen_52_part_00
MFLLQILLLFPNVYALLHREHCRLAWKDICYALPNNNGTGSDGCPRNISQN